MHYRSIWKTFGTSNEEELCFVHECTTSGYRSCENGFAYPIRSQTMFESVWEHLEDLRHVKRGRTCVSCMNALHQGTEVVKMVSPTPLVPKRHLCVVHERTISGYRSCENGFAYPIRSQTMFESV